MRTNWQMMLACGFAMVCAVPAAAQTEMPPQQTAQVVAPAAQTTLPMHSKWWVVFGGGYSMTRAGCSTCDREGVFTNSRGMFLDIGGRVSPRVDAGVEAMVVRARYIETPDPILTTFVMAVGQFRPWLDQGLYLRAGMGVGFAGKGLLSPLAEISPPYTTNGLGVTWGLGWVFRRERRVTVQAVFSQHIAALGALNARDGVTVNNVVGNFWTSGVAIVIR